MLPTHVMNEFGQSFIHKSRFGRAVGAFVTGDPVGAVTTLVTGGAPPPAQTFFPQADPCAGRTGIAIGGICIDSPIQFPGDTFTRPVDVLPPSGAVTPGAFGALSVDPMLMSTVRLRCPTGLVLGKDDRCYAQGKGGISNSQRKWPKAPRAIMSAQDGKILRKADAVRGRVKRVAATAGFTCKKK